MKVIAHMGYPKTGTTTLQKYVFQNLKVNYLGPSGGVDSRILKDFWIFLGQGDYKISQINLIKKKFPINILKENSTNLISYEGMFDLSYFANDKIFSQFSIFNKIMRSYKINVHYVFTIRKQEDALLSLLNENYNLVFKRLYFCFNNFKITSNQKNEIKIYDYAYVKKFLKKEKVNFTFIKFEKYKNDFTKILKIFENKFHLKTHKKKIKIYKTNYSIENKVKRRGKLYKFFIDINNFLKFFKLKQILKKFLITQYLIELALYKRINKKHRINRNLKFKY